MCGITGAIAPRDIANMLLQGLKRLEYRGYDSAGLAVVDSDHQLKRLRICGKVTELCEVQAENPLSGFLGIAHTRWATHGKPSEDNAHPIFFENELALVHNGIIENYQELRKTLLNLDVQFESDTDTEVALQWIGHEYRRCHDLLEAMQSTVKVLRGVFALAMISRSSPDRLIVARQGCPLVIGIGVGENYIASDPLALLPFTQRFVILEEGDVAEVFRERYVIYDAEGRRVDRALREINLSVQNIDKGTYRHFMLKEIFEQPEAVRACLSGRLNEHDVPDQVFGPEAGSVFDQTREVLIVACGTSYHAGLITQYWMEEWLGIPCRVEMASEMRYRRQVVNPGTLLVSLSQSGETADTLAAVRSANSSHYCGKLAICNVPESSLVRESGLVLLTQAGPEIGVASTKAFMTQLCGLLMLMQCLSRRYPDATKDQNRLVASLRELPQVIESVLALNDTVAQLARRFEDKSHALFIARGIQYPVVREGALKLKEISYIHAEAYPAGELKHGPLALVDKHMPVIALVARDHLEEKSLSNLQEVLTRQGELIVFAEAGISFAKQEGMTVIETPQVSSFLSPMAFTVLLQLLSYHVAVLKGTDVDQPRNLAKSVTVE